MNGFTTADFVVAVATETLGADLVAFSLTDVNFATEISSLFKLPKLSAAVLYDLRPCPITPLQLVFRLYLSEPFPIT